MKRKTICKNGADITDTLAGQAEDVADAAQDR